MDVIFIERLIPTADSNMVLRENIRYDAGADEYTCNSKKLKAVCAGKGRAYPALKLKLPTMNVKIVKVIIFYCNRSVFSR